MRLVLHFHSYFFGFMLLCGLLMVPAGASARPGTHSATLPFIETSAISVEETTKTCSIAGAIANTFGRLFPEYALHEQTSADTLTFVSNSSPAQSVELRVTADSSANAWAILEDRNQRSHASISISLRLLQRLQNHSELAFILAHEMSHVLARHKAVPLGFLVLSRKQEEHIAAVHRDWEMFADRQAALLIHNAGYRAEDAALLLRRMEPFEKRAKLPSHPSIEQRISAMRSFFDAARPAPRQTASLYSNTICANCSITDTRQTTGEATQ